jgi:hypothetical protein
MQTNPNFVIKAALAAMEAGTVIAWLMGFTSLELKTEVVGENDDR